MRHVKMMRTFDVLHSYIVRHLPRQRIYPVPRQLNESCTFSVGKLGKKSANCAGEGLITESGVDWCPKKHTKKPTKSACCFYLMELDPPPKKKNSFCKYLTEYAFLWKNTGVENCSSENLLSNCVFKTQPRPHSQSTKLPEIDLLCKKKKNLFPTNNPLNSHF